MKMRTKTMTQMAVLTAMSVLLVYLIHLPIFPAAPFLEYDPADIPILIGTFMFGPVGGIVLTAIVCVIQGLTVSAQGGIIGIVMHFIATGSFALVAGIIYDRMHTRRGAVIALVVGSLTMVAMMIGLNLVLTPIFMGVPYEAVKAMILPIILPFNLIKTGINSVVTFMVYKAVSKVLGLEIKERKTIRVEK